MKFNPATTSFLGLAAAITLAVHASHAADKADDPKLLAKATISKEAATKTALAKVPDSKVKSSELEEEKGKLIWSFDLATPGTKDVTEVNVDAKTGDVIAVEVEKASAEAKEAADEAKPAKKKSKK